MYFFCPPTPQKNNFIYVYTITNQRWTMQTSCIYLPSDKSHSTLLILVHFPIGIRFHKAASQWKVNYRLGDPITVTRSITVEWICTVQTYLCHRRLCYAAGPYLPTWRNHTSWSCPLSGQRAFWNWVHAVCSPWFGLAALVDVVCILNPLT